MIYRPHLTFVGGNDLILKSQVIKRVLTIEEIAAIDYYSDMADLSVIFNHEVIEYDDGCIRWRKNNFIDLIYSNAAIFTPSVLEDRKAGRLPYGKHSQEGRASLNLNVLHIDLHNGSFSMEEWMKFYMQMGYSLSGYAEVFGQREASEYPLPGALESPDDEEERDHYTETVIDYMRRIHKGQVLKL